MVDKSDLGNLVEEWMQGKATVRVYDGGYTGKTTEELEKVSERFSRVCCDFYESARAAKKDKQAAPASILNDENIFRSLSQILR